MSVGEDPALDEPRRHHRPAAGELHNSKKARLIVLAPFTGGGVRSVGTTAQGGSRGPTPHRWRRAGSAPHEVDADADDAEEDHDRLAVPHITLSALHLCLEEETISPLQVFFAALRHVHRWI